GAFITRQFVLKHNRLNIKHNVTHDSLLNFTTGATDRAPMRVIHVGQFPQQQNVFPHTVNKSLDCSFCGERFLSREDLIVHRATHTGESPIPCSYCGKSFVNKTTLTIHMRIHTGEKPYACMQCGKRFTQNGSLKIHLRTHSGEKPYTCNQCTASFNNPSNLQTVENRGEKRYSCRFCHKVFDTQFGRSVHKPGCVKKFPCNLCNKKFHSRCRLGDHMRVHTGEKPFPCSMCPKKFRINQSLKLHILRIHKDQLGQKWQTMGKRCSDGYMCLLCQKVMKHKYLLTEHFRIHTGEKPFKCDRCPAKFRSYGQLKVHKKKCGKPMIQCEKCEKKFPTQMRHDKHVSKYHRDWSHFCKVCGKGFFMEGRLRNHMERHQ
uniref:C2H2-type domain-containing protein n=1 Tax=Dicentrarchus labrax TaxID=13489 RepID=A0A8P4KBB3_DICLA